MNKKYLNIVGLAFRAGKCTIGEEAIVKDIRSNKVKLLLIAHNCGDTTKKKLTDKCKTFHVPYLTVDDRATLAHAIGKSERSAIAILDQGFAGKLKTLLS